jgi:hypothetical protein
MKYTSECVCPLISSNDALAGLLGAAQRDNISLCVTFCGLPFLSFDPQLLLLSDIIYTTRDVQL